MIFFISQIQKVQKKNKPKIKKKSLSDDNLINPEILYEQAKIIKNDLRRLVEESKERELKRKQYKKLSDINERQRKLSEINNLHEDELPIDDLIENLFLKEYINKEENKNIKREKFINNLPEFKYKYTEKHMSRKENECSICLEEFNSNDRVKLFSCNQHIFHKECIMKWLKKKDICPLCKNQIKY